MKIIADLLGEKKSFSVVGRNIDEKTVESLFRDVLGREIKNIERADIREVRLKDRKLIIQTVHPAVASEIWRCRERIKNRINQELGKEFIEAIESR